MFWLRSAFALVLFASALAGSGPGAAQVAPAQPETPEQTGEAPATAAENARLLAELLQDEQARQALIEELLRIAEGEDGAAAAEAVTGEPEPGVARQVADYTRGAAEAVTVTMQEVQAWVQATWTSLAARGGAGLEALGEAALALVGIIAATLIIYYLLGFVARALFEWLAGRARDAGWLKRTVLLVVSSLFDALVIVVSWAGGYALALYVLGDPGRMDVRQSMYLNAFLVVELTKVGLRLFFAPRYADLRVIGLPDLQARYWSFWLSRIVGLLGYGMLLVAPIVSFNMPGRAGLAVQYLIGLSALILAIVVILQNRRGLRRVLETRAAARAREGDIISRLLLALARVWHWLAVVYCVAFFVTWVAHPEEALPYVIRATAESIGLILIGALVAGILSRAIAGGVHLPEEIRQRLPLLEARLNAFVPAVLQVVRIAVLIVVALMIARAWGLFDVLDWAATAAGQEVVSRTIGVILILLAAGLLWLALSSWIESRLNPNRARQPSARQRTLLALARNAATIAIATVTLMLVLSEMGVNIGPLLAGAGVLGLAIGFGSQKLVQDIINGAFIQLENAFNEGDVVTVGGLTGVVERLTIRSVGLRDLQGVYHIIPFSSVDSVSNFMRGFAYHVAEIGIAYRENIDEAKALMHEAFEELCRDPEVGRSVIEPLEWHGLTTFGDSAIVLRARIKTQPGDQWAVGRAYNAIIKRLFDARGIEIPFPHVTLYFGQNKDGTAPPMHTVVDQVPAVREHGPTPAKT